MKVTFAAALLRSSMAIAIVVTLVYAVAAQQPPLAEVARREAERRKALQPATRVLTNKDLPKVATPVPVPKPAGADEGAAPPGGTASEPAAAAAEKDAAAEAPKNEAWWRARIGQARQAVVRGEVLAEALQSRINALSSDFVSRDDPFQRAKIGEDRQKAVAEMARVQSEVLVAKQMIADIEEDARKAGVAPGWLR